MCVQQLEQYLLIGKYDIDHVTQHVHVKFHEKLLTYVTRHIELGRVIMSTILSEERFKVCSKMIQALTICAVIEKLFLDTPTPPLIKEYVSLAARLTQDHSVKFIHKMLDTFCNIYTNA